MTRQEAINELGNLNCDQEIAHSSADQTLIEFLRDNGFGDVADAWEQCDERVGGFWYA